MIFIEIIDRSLCGGASRLFRRGKTITVIWILGLTLILTVALVLNLAVSTLLILNINPTVLSSPSSDLIRLGISINLERIRQIGIYLSADLPCLLLVFHMHRVLEEVFCIANVNSKTQTGD